MTKFCQNIALHHENDLHKDKCDQVIRVYFTDQNVNFWILVSKLVFVFVLLNKNVIRATNSRKFKYIDP